MRINQFLTDRGIQFERLKHYPPTYDSQHLAQALHVAGDEVALIRAGNDQQGDLT